MKVIINNINIYHIHDNRYHIDNRHNNNGNIFKQPISKPDEADLSDFSSCIVVNDNPANNDNPLIAQLKERILKSELEVKELLDKLKNETI